ncbi:NADH-quinone oxidoreductase subunit NuoG [Candidatus Magnetobacterium casense]|uniref:NADH-quinone oxidoreductase subunit NuoG n=1 Tax=Candidatus Magnetobacterium casense TaxID=1455061 RepID=A0ABS6RYP9_9BACT|nr:NADH-quinone oxidoreductase subunit NuoG [Candidatus Magnetobacterium casensis]MBV6341542.1 NADH-quinone oxidoreductase subunit NuoG [Candidatus Magnetobacterium casensis]
MIKLTINDIEVSVETPVTILEAARSVGIKIPTLCHFKGLEPYGGCRMCLVEIERLNRFQTSCTVHVTDGMVVRTETEAIRATRRAMLEFLLINHPLDCAVCDKAGECVLQELVVQYGAAQGRFAEGKRTHPENFNDPFIVRNMERCILCSRCVRMCNDVQGAYAIAITGRGSKSFVEPFSGGRYNCEYCGNCLTVCPVGAITSRPHRHSYRPWYVEGEVKTVCGFCGVGCNMVLQLRGGSIMRTMPNLTGGLNRGLLCVRGRFGYDYVDSDERLNTPLIRKNGQLVPVTWQEAISYVAQRFKDVKKDHGSKAIAAIASPRCTNEDNYMLQKFMRFILGTNNIDSTARFYYSPVQTYLESMLGVGITANLLHGIERSNGVLVIGGDPTAVNPIMGVQVRLAWRHGAKVVVVGSPGGLKMFTDYEVIPSLYAEEVVLCSVVGKVAKRKGLRGESYLIEDKINALRLPSAKDLQTAGLTEDVIDRVVDDLCAMKTPVIILGQDICQGERVSKKVFLVGAITYLLNGRIFLMSDRPNYQGVVDMGCVPDMLPGGRPVELGAIERKIKDTIGGAIPEEKGLNAFEIIEHGQSGALKALYIMGENPAFNFPDKQKTQEAINNIDFVVVQDIFMTETAKLADVVLPAAAWSEKDGTYTNLERRIQRLKKGKTVSAGKPDWRIVADVARALGMKENYTDVRGLWAEITQVSPLHFGLTYEELNTGQTIWPYNGKSLRTGEIDFDVEGIDDLPIPEYCHSEFPGMHLLPERHIYHSGTITTKSKAILGIYPEPYVLINHKHAQLYATDATRPLTDGDRVTVYTTEGEVETVVKLDKDVPDCVVLMSNTFEKAGSLGLLNYHIDPVLGCLCLDATAVRIERV